jgi:hypothetical protein
MNKEPITIAKCRSFFRFFSSNIANANIQAVSRTNPDLTQCPSAKTLVGVEADHGLDTPGG